MSHDMTKPAKWLCAQRRLRSVWSESSLSAWRKLGSLAQRRLWSDWEDTQADLSLRWAHTHFVGFVMSRLKCYMAHGFLWMRVLRRLLGGADLHKFLFFCLFGFFFFCFSFVLFCLFFLFLFFFFFLLLLFFLLFFFCFCFCFFCFFFFFFFFLFFSCFFFFVLFFVGFSFFCILAQLILRNLNVCNSISQVTYFTCITSDQNGRIEHEWNLFPLDEPRHEKTSNDIWRDAQYWCHFPVRVKATLPTFFIRNQKVSLDGLTISYTKNMIKRTIRCIFMHIFCI